MQFRYVPLPTMLYQPFQPSAGSYGRFPIHSPYALPSASGYWYRTHQPELQGGSERMDERPPQVERIDWAEQFPNEIILHGPPTKEVALTFDDGPDEVWTPQVLDGLREFGVKATFFCVGQRIQANPDVFLRMIREGHNVGNHSWNHPNLAKIPLAAAMEQINKTDEEMYRVAGIRSLLFRPPYGALTEELIRELIRLKKKTILWNVDSLDWNQITANQVAANILSHAGPGSIVLQHSAGGVGQSLQNTVNALPYVIQTLWKRGYALRTISDLLNLPAYST
ncbi:polysaccharide deacetylase family protein [Paenibacillus eucommiae]|uniref:Peptidoglycan/xylan/chitin deacetylase (PgdA/CDA1 family) n=1 Tax=Paenibacillus eucommiae TaxID=1355755 RepID=A0ABS4J735_9BACL|nr:polysaccharide deacetylase family protein [Paenibacillus eucommiae]MBP1995652.1 peptidoglycan/xylan/chitin deacetylase (PgdA/CDA1 family) [Paenibacillus eucommiae]